MCYIHVVCVAWKSVCVCMYVYVCMYYNMYSLLLSLCYKLLENPGFVREKTARDKVFGLMGSLMKRFNVALGKFSTHTFIIFHITPESTS